MKYTVLLLRPSWQRDMEQHPSDWIFRAHVEAATPEEAMGAAQDQLLITSDGIDPILSDREQLKTLAIYEGHLFDVFTP